MKVLNGSGNDLPAESTGLIGNMNPFRYRGYYYDVETGFYYLQSRYYDPSTGRFISADGFAHTGQGVLGTNMFAYCENNPVNRVDSTGQLWDEIGNFFKSAWNSVKTWAKNTFGAEATVVNQTALPPKQIIPDPLPITIKSGNRTSTIRSRHGNSSKPISVYAQGRSDNYALSSAGLRINISSFTLNVSLGLDNIGISGSFRNGDQIDSYSIKADVSQFKVGLEGSTTVEWDDNTSNTTYTNISVSGWAILAAYGLVKTGQWTSSPQQQPSY